MEEENLKEHYVGVLYEGWPGEFPCRNGFLYSYKTKLPLKEGQILKVPVYDKDSREMRLKTAKIMNANMRPEEINFPLENLTEIR